MKLQVSITTSLFLSFQQLQHQKKFSPNAIPQAPGLKKTKTPILMLHYSGTFLPKIRFSSIETK
jgi:hypothetical protein